MKIGILTFHNAINCGAVLQAKALQQTLISLGADCEVVDYRCDKLEKSYKLFHSDSITAKSIVSDLLHLPTKIKKKDKFKKFKEKQLSVSKTVYSRGNINILSKDYDKFVVGSDQVWNPEITGFDQTYVLDFCEKKQKASYAASIGAVHINQSTKDYYINHLTDFDVISVREKSSIDVLNGIINNNVLSHIDPVFLLSAQDWKKLVGKRKIKEKYVFAYCLHEQNVYFTAKDLSEKMNCKIVCVPAGLRCPIDAKLFRSLGVEEFLNLIYYSEAIVTDSFHAIAFSLIFHKKIIPVLKQELSELNGRVIDLLKLLDLNVESMNNVDYSIDFCPIDKIILSERERSIEYLKALTEDLR